MSTEVLVALLASVPGALIALIGLWVQSRRNMVEAQKIRNEAADTITDSALALIAPLKSRISELETDNVALRKRLDELAMQTQTMQAEIDGMKIQIVENNAYIDRLVYQIKSLGHEPVKRRPVAKEQ
jgi:hypothetical protein